MKYKLNVSAILCLVVCSAGGCAFNVNVKRTGDQHPKAPSAFVETLKGLPTKGEAVEFARIEAQGNNWQSASDCDAKLLVTAREIGAEALLMQPESSGAGQGSRCSGIAYLRADKLGQQSK